MANFKSSSTIYNLIKTSIICTFIFFLANTVSYAQTLPSNEFDALNFTPTNQEIIHKFHSDITILKSGDLIVEETIVVEALGNKIKRGIYRDIPTSYGAIFKDIKGLKVKEITRDGYEEPYHIDKLTNGSRIYVGDSYVFLKPGIYTYTIRYETTDQLGFFDDNETTELYWNVTGNDWDFKILDASVQVNIPLKVESSDLKLSSYVGEQGSTASGNDFDVERKSDETILSSSTGRSLNSKEGYTIVASFPNKGIIDQPSKLEQYLPKRIFNLQLVMGLILAIITAFLANYLWHKYGKDEGQLPTIPVNFYPPKGLTPAQMRVLDNMGSSDAKVISVAILNLAIKGYLKIEEDNEDYNILLIKKDSSELVDEEKIIFDTLFPIESRNFSEEERKLKLKLLSERGTVEKFLDKLFKAEPLEQEGFIRITKKPSQKLIKLKKKVDTFMRTKSASWIEHTIWINAIMYIPLIIFVIVNIAYTGMSFEEVAPILSFAIPFAVAIAGTILFVTTNLQKSFEHYPIKKRLVTILSVIATLIPFFIFLPVTSELFSTGNIGFLISIGIVALFSKYLPRRNFKARDMQNKTDGLKIFLKGQEDYISRVIKDFPDKFTMYEHYLPYAIALDLEPQWSEKFKDVFENAVFENNQNNSRMNWYDVNRSGRFSRNFTNSFAGAIAAASTNPSSSSGHSGGFSGGGGGGGGGGGW